MFEVLNGKIIRASGTRVASVSYGLGKKDQSERGNECLKGVRLLRYRLTSRAQETEQMDEMDVNCLWKVVANA